jgi:hypothetical protein
MMRLHQSWQSFKGAIMKIIIQVDGKDIELSPADTRRIFNELKEVFGEKHIVSVPSVWPASHPNYPLIPITFDGTSGTIPGNSTITAGCSSAKTDNMSASVSTAWMDASSLITPTREI